GARITVRTGETRRTRLVQSGSSYLSQSDVVQHFGLGASATYDAIEVRWPDGSTSEHSGGAADRTVTIAKPDPSEKNSKAPADKPVAEGPAG
ncbi:MAG: ASPIC/UnbV domain-containing protein, partial [Acidobacteriota bacterium]